MSDQSKTVSGCSLTGVHVEHNEDSARAIEAVAEALRANAEALAANARATEALAKSINGDGVRVETLLQM